jgi:hypothetical protein
MHTKINSASMPVTLGRKTLAANRASAPARAARERAGKIEEREPPDLAQRRFPEFNRVSYGCFINYLDVDLPATSFVFQKRL